MDKWSYSPYSIASLWFSQRKLVYLSIYFAIFNVIYFIYLFICVSVLLRMYLVGILLLTQLYWNA